MLIGLINECFETQQIASAHQPNDPLGAVRQVLHQLYDAGAQREKHPPVLAASVQQCVRLQGDVFDRLPNMLKVIRPQDAEQRRLPYRALLAIFFAEPGLMNGNGTNDVQFCFPGPSA
jgi:hypothetical protein